MKNTTLFLIINMLSGIGYSLISPLFPSLGKKDNLSEGILGWMIGIFPIAGSIFTSLVPLLCKKFSRIKLLCFATFFEATITVLYGFLIFISNISLLIIVIFALRIFHGFCSAIIGTLVYSLTISLADEGTTQSSLGKLEIAWSVGTFSGPIVASFFYNIGGYPLPFLVSGGSLYISFYLSTKINIKINKEENEEDEGSVNYLRYLFYSEIYLILIGFVICMINVTFYFPSLTYHLTKNYSLSVSTSSLFFAAPILPYMILLQFLDIISSKFGIYLTFTFGLVISGISSVFIYPVNPLPHSLIIIILGFFMIGVGSCPVFIPGLVLLSKNIKKIDKKLDELTANDIASAINTLCIELGDFTGPILGGFLTDKFGFKICCIICSFLGIAYSFVFIVSFYNNIKSDFIMVCSNKKNEKNNNNIKESEVYNKYEDYIKDIRENILANKYNVRKRSMSFKRTEKKNDSRLSLYSILTK